VHERREVLAPLLLPLSHCHSHRKQEQMKRKNEKTHGVRERCPAPFVRVLGKGCTEDGEILTSGRCMGLRHIPRAVCSRNTDRNDVGG
jgi:hypothetical protein